MLYYFIQFFHDSENSFERLFGVPEARPVRPKHLTLTSPLPPQKRKCGKPFSGENIIPNKMRWFGCIIALCIVSPLTGHVIGGGGSQVVPLPTKKGKGTCVCNKFN